MALWGSQRSVWVLWGALLLALLLAGFLASWPPGTRDKGMTVAYPARIVQLELDARCSLCEAPSWDAAAGRLLFVDITGKRIHSFDPELRTHKTVDMAEMVGAVVPSNRVGTVVAALERHIVAVDLAAPPGAHPSVLATVPAENHRPGDRFNDAKVSPGGVLIAGRMNQCPECREGALYSLKSAATLHRVSSEQLLLPNGMAWSVSRQIMYFADTFANAVYAYKTDARGVPLAKKRSVAIKVYQPDGLTLDSHDNIWVVSAESGFLLCFSPEGVELQRVLLPVKRATAVTFGGPDLDIMFVTTRATEAGQSTQLGGLYSLKIRGIRGAAAAHPFTI